MHAVFRWPSRTVLGVAYAVSGAMAGAISLGFAQSKNFEVFSQAARDILARRDLYELHTVDYFKYSPTFALFFLPFTLAPAWLGATVWSFANFLLAFFGIDRIVADDAKKRTALLVAYPGIVLSTDGDQSNLLVTGAFFLALHALEKRRIVEGAIWVTVGALVKLFPVLGVVFALFRPIAACGRVFGAMVLTGVLGLLVPLAVLTPRELVAEYVSWGRLLAQDHENLGWSVMHMLQMSHLGPHLRRPNFAIQVVGLFAQIVPIVLGVRRGTSPAWRRSLACTLLVFTVLFNHRSEYASFVISAIAVGIWYATSAPSWIPPSVRRVLVVLSILAPGPFLTRPDPRVTGIFSIIAAHREFHPLRVVPLLLLWILMNIELLRPLLSARHAYARAGSTSIGG